MKESHGQVLASNLNTSESFASIASPLRVFGPVRPSVGHKQHRWVLLGLHDRESHRLHPPDRMPG